MGIFPYNILAFVYLNELIIAKMSILILNEILIRQYEQGASDFLIKNLVG